jgi:hypothetical protein
LKFLSETLNGRDLFEDQGVNERIVFKCTLKKYGRRMWASFIWFWIETRGGLL